MLAYRTMAQDVRPTDSDNHGLRTPMNNTASTTQVLDSTESLADNVSSLRALALSTLRSKRRRDTAVATSAPSRTLPFRPVPHDSVLLDYGSETIEDQDVKVALPLATNYELRDRLALQPTVEAEVKEEGEISDEEFRASSIASSSSPVDGARHLDRGLNGIAQAQASTSRVRIKSDPERSSTSSSGRHPTQSATIPQVRDIWNNWVPSDDHVRPGLKMNMDQFNLVKELILDLLGWGVSPEYLVDCGLTREAVFYTFMELNLRLPKNLDVSGLLPSSPRDDAPSSIMQPSIRYLDSDKDNSSPASVSTQSRVSSRHVRNPSLSHPLPAKPQALPPSAAPAVPTTSTQQAPSNGQNLSDMEARKRQELQARKAVLASRRKKVTQNSSAGASTPSTSTPVPHPVLDGIFIDEPAPIIPATAIDDFLKSMMETTATPPHPSTPAPTPKAKTLSGGVTLGVSSPVSASANSAKTSPVTSAFPFPSLTDVDSTTLSGEGSIAHTPINKGVASLGDLMMGSSHSAASQVTSRSTVETTPLATSPQEQQMRDTSASSPAFTQVSGGRRGTKRPVAMDFVDVEHSAHGSTSMPAPPPYVRRKFGGFAGLGGHAHRKCVIDLSDSEDDDRDENAIDTRVLSSDRTSTSAKSNVLRKISPPTPRPSITRPSSIAGIESSKPASPGLSPEALEEKERQIKQMREAIARREQDRLRKLAEKSRTPAVTPPPPSSSTSVPDRIDPSGPTFRPKAEEPDVQLHTSAPSKSVARPSYSESSSFSDRADEDIVMQSLEPTSSTSTIESALPTPTDIKSIVLEHSTTREPVLTAEAQGESGAALDNNSEDNDFAAPVDVAGPDTSSAEVNGLHEGPLYYSTYNSPFCSYPLLRSRSRLVLDTVPDSLVSRSSSLAGASWRSSSSSSSSFDLAAPKVTIPDLRPLKMAAMLREAGNDLGRRICQYEVPGGGMCRDETCTDLHLGDMEPDDHETARYLREVMPSILQAFSEADIVDQLLQARQKQSGFMRSSNQADGADSLEDRVSAAITALVSGR